jgi:hypothetical protein
VEFDLEKTKRVCPVLHGLIIVKVGLIIVIKTIFLNIHTQPNNRTNQIDILIMQYLH